ncbi:hypothetical protein MIN45_P1387 [Methylomarinovum tepidoasis]|uniref:Uncharacterized protein n=1 Tax=Methylomarinovum tepidoasis TaxID=2840183 RepID=A0AAU9CN08_9GAMM|nr:hypothetical protein [Methylomarinovum sp. IN45]BCX89017.1 hypothetical protein MIN45_P1387 [Methylomarinovum sp. IN45]
MSRWGQNFVFPLFTVTAAILAVVFWLWPPLLVGLKQYWLWVLSVGVVALVLVLLLAWRGLLSPARRYDLLLWASLWLWLGGWLNVFFPEAPLFKIYPVYFVLLDVFVGRFRFAAEIGFADPRERELVETLLRQWWFSAPLWAGIVLLTLLFPQRYLAYPLAVSVLTLRLSLGWVLGED